MSFIFYNFRLTDDETQGKAFLVRSAEATYWDANKNLLGYPTTNKMTKEIALPGETESKTLSFQVFEGGLLYNDRLTGAIQYRSGLVYDEIVIALLPKRHLMWIVAMVLIKRNLQVVIRAKW